ncbi:Recombination protein MgsA [Magnetococcus marinus MC-1]|uniref:Replication-associated recombination protein A n=1 Tax=Magnetococcus marinus (strain ATCC BAA-1437 / JCM 17883 / MC-1) TaxID=156889 RepID=A0L888_MAGMM|nr:replication-associated recombination protein A [Magnetococcus marinus]ABK44181.1 Recombination protein MgsA [Magnetococcus marinus MC-1]
MAKTLQDEPLRAPLAERMRPRDLAELVGQEELADEGRILHEALCSGHIPSMILWGPPGCGKTTIARMIATQVTLRFESLSAVLAGVKEVRLVVDRAREARVLGQGTILFVDEIHRFNKAQQDAFLPYVESGDIILIGATTENPSFELNGALLSRCRVVELKPLHEAALVTLLQRALVDQERGLERYKLAVEPEALQHMAQLAAGDGRYALNLLETFVELAAKSGVARGSQLTLERLKNSLQRRAALYDKAGDGHYNLISALHKSLRGSDVDAALYWLARMLEGGEEGLYIARRLVRFATEDVGNADPRALSLAMDARDAYHFLGAPEGELALAQCVVYLATAPKSNSVYTAFKAARKRAIESGAMAPPKHILNAPTATMQALGYGVGYQYAHDYEEGFVAQQYLPDALQGERFYYPVERGFERDIAKRMAYWDKLREQAKEEGKACK